VRLGSLIVPFWPEKMDPGVRDARMDLFEKAIYTTWAPFFVPDRDLSEMEAMHLADKAILAGGFKVDRSHWENDEVSQRRQRGSGEHSRVYER